MAILRHHLSGRKKVEGKRKMDITENQKTKIYCRISTLGRQAHTVCSHRRKLRHAGKRGDKVWWPCVLRQTKLNKKWKSFSKLSCFHEHFSWLCGYVGHFHSQAERGHWEGTHIRQIKDVFPLSRFFVKAQFIASSPIRMSLRLFEKRDGNSSSCSSPFFLHQHFSRVFNSDVR